MKRIIAKTAIPAFAKLYRFSYWALSQLVVWEGGGHHPKHDILRYHEYITDRIDVNDRVLDVGCGQGSVADDAASKAKEVVGIDFSEKNISIAKKRYDRDNLQFVVADATKYSPKKKFDKIILSNVLEHIKDRVGLLKSLARLSDTIIIRVPLIERDWLAVYLRDKGLTYKLDRTHETEYTVQQVHEEAQKAGWKVNEYTVEFGEFLGVLSKN